MTFPLILHLIMRLLHILAATAWVGGSLMYQLVIGPALRATGAPAAVSGKIAQLFTRLVNICIAVLLLTGAYLTFDRLTQTSLGLPYLITLGLKIVGALGLFLLAIYLSQSNLRRLAKRSTSLSKAAPQLMLVLGIIVFFLGALLNTLFEASIAPH